MVTENNAQINTFVKGMDTDTSYQMIEEGKYVLAENIRLTSLNGTGHTETTNAIGEVRQIEGVKECLSDNIKINAENILAVNSIRDYGIIIYTDPETECWNVARFLNTPSLDDEVVVIDNLAIIFESEQKPQVKRFSTVMLYEDADVVKLYIADSVNPIILLNVAANYTNDEYNKALKISEAFIYPEVSYTPPKFVETITGALKPALVQYSYRLYNKNGISTDISPQTKLIPIIQTPSSLDLKTTEGYLQEETSSIGIRIQIKESDTMLYLNRILIYRITYIQNGQLPTIEVVEDCLVDRLSKITSDDGNYYQFDDRGGDGIDVLTVEEYNSFSGIHIIPKVLESKDDYLFAGNIKQITSWVTEKELDEVDITPYFVKLRLIGDGIRNDKTMSDLYKYEEEKIPTYISNAPRYIQFAKTDKLKDEPISSDAFDIKIYSTSVDNDGYIRVGSRVQNDTLKDSVSLYLDTYKKSCGTMSYADVMASYYCKSLRRGEVYRYGIIFYNKYGESSKVRYIGDFETPNMYNDEFRTFKYQYAGSQDLTRNGIWQTGIPQYNLYVFPLGLMFDVKNIPEGSVSYEIVRCNRSEKDIRTISQGVLSRPCSKLSRDTENLNDGDEGFKLNYSSYTLTPLPYITTSNYVAVDCIDSLVWESGLSSTNAYRWATNEKNDSIFLFISPEITYLNEYMKTVTKYYDLYLKKCQYIFPYLVYVPNLEALTVDSTDSDNLYLLNYRKIKIQQDTVFNLGADIHLNGSRHWYLDKILNFHILLQASYGFATVGDDITYTIDGDIANHSINGIFDSEYVGRYNYTNGEVDFSDAYPSKKCEEIKRTQYAFIKLYLSDNRVTKTVGEKSYKVKNTAYPTNLNWDEVFTKENNSWQNTYLKTEIAIGERSYNNIIIPTLYNDTDRLIYEHVTSRGRSDCESYIGLAGPSLLLSIDNIPTDDELVNTVSVPDTKFLGKYVGTFLCNLQRNVTPYNGLNLTSIASSIYYSYGNFYTSDVEYAVVFDGDTYIMPFEYLHSRKYYAAKGENYTGRSMTTIYSIPVETSMNLAYTSGFEFSKNKEVEGISNLQLEPSRVYDRFTQQTPTYVYNSAYSSGSTSRLFSGAARDIDSNDLINTDYRIYRSLRKDNKQNTDNWTKFQAANYIDLDTRRGELTNMRKFKDELLFWQLTAFGKLSVNERSIVTDNNSQEIMLGASGVLDHFSYYDDTAGMAKEQYCDTQSNTTIYWFDDHNQELKSYGGQKAVQHLSKQGKVLNIMHKLSDVNKIPTMFFDERYNEVISNVLKDRQLAYSEYGNAFTSLYTLHYTDAIKFENKTYLIANNNGTILIGQWNIVDGTSGKDFKIDDSSPILKTYLQFVINKSSLQTKVFDNQEIVTVNKPFTMNGGKSGLELPSKLPYFKLHHKYAWATDLNQTETDDLDMTYREGNYRYAIPRQNNAEYGDRIRGKYLICSIEDTDPDYDASISYIITKFRASWS